MPIQPYETGRPLALALPLATLGFTNSPDDFTAGIGSVEASPAVKRFSKKIHVEIWEDSQTHTVDGGNPAPPGMFETL